MTAPTLSAPGVIDITANSARPQVTLTYGAAWTPAEITTALWVDAADSNTITLNGSNVSQWDDKSTNNRHVSQGTTGAQPGYTSAESVNFDGSDDNLFRTDAFMYAAGKAYVFAVVTPDSVRSNNYLFSEGSSSNSSTLYSLMIQQNSSNPRHNAGFIRNDANAIVLNQDVGVLFGTWVEGQKILLAAEDTGSNYGARKNGGDASSGGYTRSGTVTPNRFTIGGLRRGTFSSAMHVKVHEFIVLTADPSTEDRQKIEGYLAWKWGLEANLPSGHPYENAAP